MARFLIDENLSPYLAQELRRRGAEARHLSELGLRGRSDLDISKYALDNNWAVVTEDVGFTNHPTNGPGIALSRIANHVRLQDRINIIATALQPFFKESLLDTIIVIDEARVRVRKKGFHP